MKKWCPKCENNLDTSLFYRDISKPDGLTSTCKQCRRNAQKKYRIENEASVKHYEDERRQTNERKEYSAEYQKAYRHYNKIRADKFDKRTIARKLINDLIASKKLRRPIKCEINQTIDNVQYHHTDYDYPYIVVALSHDIHEIIHKTQVYTTQLHENIRSIVELTGKRRQLYYSKHGLTEYLRAFNAKII